LIDLGSVCLLRGDYVSAREYLYQAVVAVESLRSLDPLDREVNAVHASAIATYSRLLARLGQTEKSDPSAATFLAVAVESGPEQP
jgi:hypothetical protein